MKVGIVAGEASGDLLGASLVRALRETYPDIEFIGIAGPRMQAAGAQSWFPMEALAVRGYVEVLRHLPRLVGMRARLVTRMLEERPRLFIGIDAPDFNFGVETRLRQAGITTVHYVSPSLWAWRGERIHAVRRAVDRMLALFPFEVPIYEKAGVAAACVGHPFADEIPLASQRDDAREQLRLKPAGLYIALLPGSRQSELDYHADLFIDTARLLAGKFPDARFLVPLATRETREQFDRARYRRSAEHLPLQVLFGHSRLALAAADVALVASGTATLEAALLGCPHVITYRISRISYALMKRKALLPFIGLPNILAQEFVVPEILQDDASPANLAQALANLLAHKTMREKMRERFNRIHRSLRLDNPARVVAALRPYLDAAR